MNALGQVAPAHEVGAGAVDTGEVRVVALLRDGGVNVVADGDQARGQQAHAALGPGKEILEHLVVGTAGLLGHLTVAHGGHDQPVLHRQLVDLDGREQRGVGIEVPGHACRAACAVFAVGAHPVAEAVDQLLYQNVFLQGYALTFLKW